MPKLKESIWLDAYPLRWLCCVIEETFDYGLNFACVHVYLLVASTVTCVVPFCPVRKKRSLSSTDSLKTPRIFQMIVIIMTVVTII